MSPAFNQSLMSRALDSLSIEPWNRVLRVDGFAESNALSNQVTPDGRFAGGLGFAYSEASFDARGGGTVPVA